MSQRKLIVSLTIAILLAVTAGVGQASLSRMEGMGLDVPLLSQFTDDYANIYTYPTSVVRQNNLVLAEVGQNSDSDAGVNPVDVTDQSYTVIRNFPSLGAIAFQMAQSNTESFAAAQNLNNEQLDIIWGRAFSTLDFAIRLDITNSRYEYTDNTPSGYEAMGVDFSFDPYPFGAAFFENAIVDPPVGERVELNTWGVTPSIALHFGEDDRFELAGTYRRYTLDRSESPAGASWEDGGNASYAVFARGILHRGGTHTWYPAAWYVNDDLSWEVNGVATTARTADETYRVYGAGISDNMRVNDNNLLLWGISVAEAKHKYERTDNNDGVASLDTRELTEKATLLPLVFAALETEATSWLKIRIGASRGHLMERNEFTNFQAAPFTFEEKIRTSEFRLGLGAGIRWNNLDIDMAINNQFPLSGGYILSGNEATPFNRVSATYHF